MVDVDESLLSSFANFAPKWRKYEQEGKLQRVQALHAHTSGRSAMVMDCLTRLLLPLLVEKPWMAHP